MFAALSPHKKEDNKKIEKNGICRQIEYTLNLRILQNSDIKKRCIIVIIFISFYYVLFPSFFY